MTETTYSSRHTVVSKYHLAMAITYEFWVSNLLQSARDLADAGTQAQRWVASDAKAWERPTELLCVLSDDCNFELFIKEHHERLSDVQLVSATELLRVSLAYDCGPDGWRDPVSVLNDSAWEDVREKARAFIAAYSQEIGESEPSSRAPQTDLGG